MKFSIYCEDCDMEPMRLSNQHDTGSTKELFFKCGRCGKRILFEIEKTLEQLLKDSEAKK